ncbi:MAG: right-handed parallel beta-helix repeat-containing protein [Verrucomicrobiota bacterium]
MKKILVLSSLFLTTFFLQLMGAEIQPLDELQITEKRFATVEARTDHGKFSYHLDNSGKRDVSAALQEIFTRLQSLEDTSVSLTFLPGVYFIDQPIDIKLVSLEMRGTGHGGLDVHGMNLKSGTIFRFGKNTGPNCLTFHRARHQRSFPAGETPWKFQNSKVSLEGLTFMGHNNTGVDTAAGYSRMRGDEPNFRGLHWFPAKDRYQDPEKEGQRALVFPAGWKNELLRVNNCFFTELYVGIDADHCDVCYLTDNWFAQLAYGIRIKGSSPVAMIKNNCFADLETAVILGNARASNLNGNGFAYVSKCFQIDSIFDSTISHNTVTNWKKSTGAAAFGAFCYVANSENLVISGNAIRQELDSRTRTRTIDEKPNGRSFITIENSKNLLFSQNIVHTIQTQTVVRLHNVTNSLITDNLITFGEGGNAVAQTGNSSANLYRPSNPAQSAHFDEFKN